MVSETRFIKSGLMGVDVARTSYFVKCDVGGDMKRIVQYLILAEGRDGTVLVSSGGTVKPIDINLHLILLGQSLLNS